MGTVLPVTATPAQGAPAGVRSVVLRSGVYADSVRLMQVSRDVAARDGVTAVLVAMATTTAVTPSRAPTSRLTCMSRTESA